MHEFAFLVTWSTQKINFVIGFICTESGDIFSGMNVLRYCSTVHWDRTNCSMLLLFPIKLINFCVSMCSQGHIYGPCDVSKFFNSIYVTIERRATLKISIAMIVYHWEIKATLIQCFMSLCLLQNEEISWKCLTSLFDGSLNLSCVTEKLDCIDFKLLSHHASILCQAIDVSEFGRV